MLHHIHDSTTQSFKFKDVFRSIPALMESFSSSFIVVQFEQLHPWWKSSDGEIVLTNELHLLCYRFTIFL